MTDVLEYHAHVGGGWSGSSLFLEVRSPRDGIQSSRSSWRWTLIRSGPATPLLVRAPGCRVLPNALEALGFNTRTITCAVHAL